MKIAAPNQVRDFDIRRNNFDLLRLFAASQVAYLHVAVNLNVPLTGILRVLRDALEYFPGVPKFFVISGFLISASLDRNPDLRSYTINRFLRIYPALWTSTLVALVLMLLFGNRMWDAIASAGDSATYLVSKWLVTQFTVAQFYNPYPMKLNYGVGHLNGSLWTIPVELQFYILLPILSIALWRGLPARNQNLRLVGMLILLYAVSHYYRTHTDAIMAFSENLAMLTKVSIVPYLYMFLLGVILQRNFGVLGPVLRAKGLLYLVAYLLVAWSLRHAFGARVGTNLPNLLSMTFLSFAVVSLAFTCPDLSKKMLHENDISYGTYVYHMILANVAFELGYTGTTTVLLAVLLGTFVLAGVSWRVIEAPALRLKHSPFLLRELK